jgi:hypothetical protein
MVAVCSMGQVEMPGGIRLGLGFGGFNQNMRLLVVRSAEGAHQDLIWIKVWCGYSRLLAVRFAE